VDEIAEERDSPEIKQLWSRSLVLTVHCNIIKHLTGFRSGPASIVRCNIITKLTDCVGRRTAI
jgi:hypothetical protein